MSANQCEDFDYGYFIAVILLIFIVCGIIWYLFFYKTSNSTEKFEVRQRNKVENFKEKIQILEDKVNNFIENEPIGASIPNVDKERELFEMYYKGVPDTYDIRGRLIRGVEPDAAKAIYYLQKIIESPFGTEKDVISLARIYHYGMHRFERNLDKAEEIYNGLKFETITMETRVIIKEALADIQKIRVYTWLNLPLERPTVNPELDVPVVVNIPAALEEQPGPRRQPIIIQPIVNLPGIPRRQVIDTTLRVDQKDYNDPQNTHNPQVLSTIRHSLEKLKTDTQITKSQGVSITEIKAYINQMEESDKKQDALRSLRAIENNPDRLSSTNMTESDALTLVWNRINDSKRFNEETTKNLKETLFDELASMQEFGVTICSTGRFTHIVDTLNGVDEEVSIKPTYAINEEMMSKSAKIREDMLKDIPEIERKHLEAGTSQNQSVFETELKNTIIDKLRKDYVDTGILTGTKFDLEVGKWIDHI